MQQTNRHTNNQKNIKTWRKTIKRMQVSTCFVWAEWLAKTKDEAEIPLES